ncbi:hypothetical protein DAPPUDRAFT_261220 [Daphnia pulex]|uniref:Uncharacterized protein n=1 Tax=Daphnia pulex TaxID=6669 RepID=E9HKQ6_DAPPU|nr:hypothetical protein DAPPUDRAFT_261220 [Daphnia pulex]|eukprot:EFX67649.1 hypothetical protein DAPPUDRAFT_261220 [Daphnia pulex]
MQYPSLAGNVIHSLVLPEWISGCEKYTLYPRMTQHKSSQPVYWENTMNNRNPKSDWLEYELVNYLKPHDLITPSVENVAVICALTTQL